jgi:hypothetical protein
METKGCIYSRNDVCEMLGISTFTLTNWYKWERKELSEQIVDEEYLPRPVQLEHVKGRPLRWSYEMVTSLMEYKEHIVKGRNGRFGKYTNTKWH